jgi:hypothetical protein
LRRSARLYLALQAGDVSPVVDHEQDVDLAAALRRAEGLEVPGKVGRARTRSRSEGVEMYNLGSRIVVRSCSLARSAN